jgi:hypothetical protein
MAVTTAFADFLRLEIAAPDSLKRNAGPQPDRRPPLPHLPTNRRLGQIS